MSDDDGMERKIVHVPLEKGYTPAPRDGDIVGDGYTPSSGQLGTPPTQGSAVSKPVQPKKD